jgi:hypothetical protein
MNRLFFILCLWVLPVLALAQAVPSAMPAPTTNLPPPMPAPTTNLPPPMPAPTPLVVPTAPMYLNASQTFISRGSTATYFDSTGTLQTAPANTPRYDYDPITHVAKGILVEPRRTNILKYPNPMSGWIKYITAMISDSTILGPDGVSPMAQVVANASSHVAIVQKLAIQPHKNYVFSIFYKPGNISYIALQLSDEVSQACGIFINLYSNTTASSGGFPLDNGVIPIGDGIYRAWVKCNFPSIPNPQKFRIGLVDSTTTGQPATIGNYVYLWGAQVEQADSLSSYIPTNGTPATRAQDVYQQF